MYMCIDCLSVCRMSLRGDLTTVVRNASPSALTAHRNLSPTLLSLHSGIYYNVRYSGFLPYSTMYKLLTIYYCARWDRQVENVGMKGSLIESAYEPAEQIF